jgi:hypothetical protein
MSIYATLPGGKKILILSDVYDYIAAKPQFEKVTTFKEYEPATTEWTGQGLATGRCSSPGQKEGVVVTEPMVMGTGWINAKRKEVGLREQPAKGTLVAAFDCGLNTYEIRGSVVGALSPVNKVVGAKEGLSVAIAINPETGRDAVTHLEGGPESVLEIQENGEGFHEVAIEDPGTLSPAEGTTIEVKAGSPKKQPELVIKQAKK